MDSKASFRAHGFRGVISLLVFLFVVLFLGIVIKTQLIPDEAALEREIVSPWIYIGLLAGCALTAFTPAMPVALLGGRVFGLWPAALYTFLGGGLGMLLAYLVGRWGGRPGVALVVGDENLASFEGKLTQTLRFRTILILRIFPHPLYDAVSYLCGIGRVPFQTYLAASLLGAGPGCLLFPWVGERIVRGGLLIAVLIWIVTAILLYVVGRGGKSKNRVGFVGS